MTANTAQILSFDIEKQIDPDKPQYIEPGVYDAVMVDWKVYYNNFYRRHLLLMHFRIVEMGEFNGAIVPGWFNVQPTKSKTTVKAGWRSNFLRMYQECFNIKLERRDRIPMSRFKSIRPKVEVVTIGKDTQGQRLAKINHYSRVGRVLKAVQ